MSARPRKPKKSEKTSDGVINVNQVADTLKPGETKMIGDMWVASVTMVVCDPPEPMKRRRPRGKQK